MIELFLSTDGKHTVHVTTESVEEMARLAPEAEGLYKRVLEEFGTKAQMWESAINGKKNGRVQGGRRVETVEQAQEAVAPRCPKHGVPMAYRQGRRGPFWSCPTREPNGEWCQATQEVFRSGNDGNGV